MKRTIPFISCILTIPALATIDLKKDVWLYADFDHPVRVQGNALFFDMDKNGWEEGRFGKGYHFYRATNNKLLPMSQFFADSKHFIVTEPAKLELRKTSAKFSGGTFEIASVPTGIKYHWVGNDAGNTWSFYAKGKKGTKVTIYPTLTELTKAQRKDCDKKHPLKNELKDTFITNTVELTGDWQRISTHLITDVRTAEKRKTALVINSDGPFEFERVQLQVSGIYPYKKQFAPEMWIDGGRMSRGTIIRTTDLNTITNFPFKAGSIAFWIKNGPDVSQKYNFGIFSLTRPWGSEWYLKNDEFKCGNRSAILKFKTPIPRSETWRHVTVSWQDGRIAYYLDGSLNSEIIDNPKKKREIKCSDIPNLEKGSLRIGNAIDGHSPSGAVFDDVVIFNRPLTTDEILSLATSKKSLFDGANDILAEKILFNVFFRDQKDAALHFKIAAPEAGEYELYSKIGGIERPVLKRFLPKGESYLEVPLEPAKYRPGIYQYEFSLVKDSKTALHRKGELEIKGRLGIDTDQPFIFNSWGGYGYIRPSYLQTLGVNAYNIGSDNSEEVKVALENGMFANIRYENGRKWFIHDFDMEKIKEDTKKDLMKYSKLGNWRTMLLNSEIYGSIVSKEAKENPKYLKMLEANIGIKPDFTYTDAPSEVDWKKLGVPPIKGEIDHKACPPLETVAYVCKRGLPPMISNYKTTEAVKELKKDVLVWSEPCYGELFDSVEMGSDWEYDYSTTKTLRELIDHYAVCRKLKRFYQPTLSGSYFSEIKGEHPTLKDKDGKPQAMIMCQSADEVTIKTWLSMGAIPMHNLSWFTLSSWQLGQENAKKYIETQTNTITHIAEPDCSEVYGKRWKETLYPSALLLRDMPNEKAKIAFLHLPEARFAGNFWWGFEHFTRNIKNSMATQSALFDVISCDEIKAGYADDYDYLVCPMSKVIYKDNADALRKIAAKGVKIVLDSYATTKFDNCIHLEELKYLHPRKWEEMNDTFLSWYTNIVKDVAKKSYASSMKSDGKTSFTFVKEYKGAKYVVVINDKRDEKPSFLNKFKTNEWYRVVGAPQKINTEIKMPKGYTMYGFNGAKAPDQEYAPAEGRIFAIYPKALKKPALKLLDKAKVGESVKLIVKITDVDGKSAPGRQVVRLTFTDNNGVVRDESGLYTVEDGRVEITLRIPACEKPTGFFSKWKAEVEDLTTGFKNSIKVGIRK